MEGKRFATTDKFWRTIMAAAAKGGGAKVIEYCNDGRLCVKLKESNELLDMVQKGLGEYLGTKRAGFARFYFLSDEELLEILSETKDPLAVQPHLRKVFEGIKTVGFNDDVEIISMTSPEKEMVPFKDFVDPKHKNIEDWMVLLKDGMKAAVREQMMGCLQDYPTKDRTEWMLNWPAMCILNGSQVFWTSETEALMESKGNQGLKEYIAQCQSQLNDMVFLIRSGLTSGQRTTVGALAVVDVHAKDVMGKMADDGVATKSDFAWLSQMKYYWWGDWSPSGKLWVIAMSSRQSYDYEYLGNSFRLVITPLTDKCYLTIMSALQMNLGGAPAGPAGTGKTETTKDLAKALAKMCVVFNCSDQVRSAASQRRLPMSSRPAFRNSPTSPFSSP